MGAVILDDLDSDTQEVLFWYAYRIDGKGVLDLTDDAVVAGHGRAYPIEFGPFHFRPDLIGDRQGGFGMYSIPYQRSIHEEVEDGDLAIVGTNLTVFEGMDAMHPRWEYRTHAADTRFERRQP